MTSGTLTSVVVVALAGVVAALVADLLRRWLVVPATVLEIGFGIVLGPVLSWVTLTPEVDNLAGFGLAMLFFLAGYEVDPDRIRGRPLARAAGSWLFSLLLGLSAGMLLATLLGGGLATAAGLGLMLATTALGAILPMVRDAGLSRRPLGAAVMAVGAVGEFGPILLIAVLFSGDRPVHTTALLLAFLVAAAVALAVAARPAPGWLAGPLTATLGTSAQLAVRLSMLAVLALVWLATELHLDLVLGAFAAGMVMRLVLASLSRPEVATVESKLEGIGFGLLVPFFFVTVGLRFDLDALLDSPAALILVPVGLAGFLVVRGVPVALAFGTAPPRERVSLGLYAATALPLVVVLTDAGVAAGWLDPAAAAALVGAAMLSVLVFPLVAQRLLGPVAWSAAGEVAT